jgi:hypothetical protein
MQETTTPARADDTTVRRRERGDGFGRALVVGRDFVVGGELGFA